MGAAKKLLDKKVLKGLTPLNALSAVHLEEISRKAVIETVRSGRYVFKAGDRDYQSVYLLEGKVEVIDSGREVVSSITSGSEAANHPLAHKQPREISVRAAGSVTVARIDSSLLDVLLTWDESSGYDVVEIGAEDDGDWMTRMLQSQAFMQLPPSNIHQLLMRLESISVPAGELVIKQDDDGDYFYIVKSGRLAVSRKASARSKEVLLAELGEGACFGEEALVSGTRRNATVTMLTDGSLMRLSKDDFDELLRTPLVHEVDYTQAKKLADEGAVWLDVRLPGEFSNQYIRDSRNLPLSALREQANELDNDKRYIVCCDTGRRSATGAFILGQRGFDVYTLRNGLMDVPSDVLNGTHDKEKSDVPVHDAEIIPFENDIAADGVKTGTSRQDVNDTDSLDEQLRVSEAALNDQRLEAEALRQRIESLENGLRDSELQNNELALQLEKSGQAQNSAAETNEEFEKQRAQLESELAQVREDYQQLGQRTSAVAGERDAKSRELEEARGELADFKARFNTQQGEANEQVSALQEQLDARAHELEDAVTRLGELETSLTEAEKTAGNTAGRESELVAQVARLEQQVSEQEKLSQEGLQAQKTAHEEELQALQDSARDFEQRLAAESGENEVLAGKLANLEQQLTQSKAAEQSLNESLEQALRQADEAEQSIRDELQKEQDALSTEIANLKDAVAEQDQLAEQLQERDKEMAEASQSGELVQQQLEEQAKELDSIRQSLESSKGEFDELEKQLKEKAGHEDQLNRRVTELEQQLESLEGEHESDLGSAREAMARAQTELDNLKREQQRLLKSLRKAEETLDRERHDHESEVRRLHKEMKSAAGDSAEGMAAELEALQIQISEGARMRDDLEVSLGERSNQLEDMQVHADQLDQQLKLAQQSAREAEQQLIESNRIANEEMEIRLNTEQGIQQGLRDALEKSERERNSHQEAITVINQELEELRDAYQQSKQMLEGQEDAVSHLAEAQTRLDIVQAERDELQSLTDSLQNELDQLRAETEVRRGLEGMLSDDGASSVESEELQQAKQNVEVAVRLRAQAEDQVEILSQEVAQLKEQLGQVAEIQAPTIDDGAIPSLDIDDPHASNPMLSGVSDFEDTDVPEPAVLPDDVIASTPEVTSQAPKSGLVKGLLAGLVIGAATGAGLYWWQAGSGQLTVPFELGDKQVLSSVAVETTEESPANSQQPTSDIRKAEEAQDESAAVKTEDTGKKDSQKSEVQEPKKVSREAEISDRSRSFPLAKGMPDIPRSAAVSTTVRESAQTNTDTSEAQVAVQEPDVEPEPAVEQMVEQPAGGFRDRLSNGGKGPAMMRFRTDHFLMGSSAISQKFDERPQHEVQLESFAIATHEITFKEYDAFARATGRRLPDDMGWGRSDLPVISVSWEDARAYTQWLSEQTGARYRLPTEAEWEFVARSGTMSRYWWGERVGEGRANCFDCGSADGGVQPSSVGSFPASPWGVYDMAGNVREWVQDCYTPNYSRASGDGRAVDAGRCSDRVVRGGAYSSPSAQLRSTSRDRVGAQSRLDNLGFRVVREY